MRDYLVFMHSDTRHPEAVDDWEPYVAALRERGMFAGGSALAPPSCFQKDAAATTPPRVLTGYIRIRACDLADARTCLAGNPVYEAGGTVEICELIED